MSKYKKRYFMEYTWSGYRPSKSRVCHAQVTKSPDKYPQTVGFSDNTTMTKKVRELAKGERTPKAKLMLGYVKLLEWCKHNNKTGFVHVDEIDYI